MQPEPPDLTAELDAAEDIVTGRADKIVTEWGSRDLGDPGGVVFEYRHLGEVSARHATEARTRNGIPCMLVRRTVTYGPWEEVPDPVRPDIGGGYGDQSTTACCPRQTIPDSCSCPEGCECMCLDCDCTGWGEEYDDG